MVLFVRRETTIKRSPDLAYELATRTKPLVTRTTISIDTSVNGQCAPDVDTDSVEGFTQIPWRSTLWDEPLPPAPGTDATYDYGRRTEDRPAAIMSSIVQGDSYAPQVSIMSPE